MNDVPVELIVAAFNDEQAADDALKVLKQAKKEKLIKIENAAVLRKDQKGKLHIKETADIGGGKGAVVGGVAGATIGLIAGPLLVVPAAVGALVGGLTAKLKDSGFSDDRLEQLGEGLTPGSSAIVAVVDHTWVAAVQEQLAQEGADLITAQLQADIASQLEAGHEVAYSALVSQEGYDFSRVATGEDMVEGSELVVTEDEIYGGKYVATGDGFAVQAFDATEEGVVVAEAAGEFEEQEEAEAQEAIEDGSEEETEE